MSRGYVVACSEGAGHGQFSPGMLCAAYCLLDVDKAGRASISDEEGDIEK